MRLYRPWLLSGALGAAAAASVLVAQVVETRPAAPAPTSAPASQPVAPGSQALPPYELAQIAETTSLVSGLIGSKHDFTLGGKEGRELCLPCHVPHLINVPPPLLDRRPPIEQPLRPYQEPGLELTGWSLLCLGCHDGVTAPDVYSGPHATTVAAQFVNPPWGPRGRRSHPVGIVYPAGRSDYNPADAVETAGLRLPDGRIQCTTCHDAHNTRRFPGMLWISNDRSRLCLTCHRL